jgi:uncharacterized damage-inducible protein DinB/RimJ/RimL family protein N-acetyltransferase
LSVAVGLERLRRLVDHAVWADIELLSAVERAGDIAPVARREYLHVLGAAETWLARIEGRPPRVAVWPDAAEIDPGPLRERVAAGYAALLAGLGASELHAPVSYTNSAGISFADTVEDIVLHVVLHGQYHRGKVNLILRSAGASPAPTDYIAFVRGAPAATQADAGLPVAAEAAPTTEPTPAIVDSGASAHPVRLLPVTMTNRGDLDDIEPGHPERYLVHSNWYWHQVSLERPQVAFRLVHAAEGGPAVGMVAYGPSYRDRALTERCEGEYEIHHLVIDRRHQARGIGRAVADQVLSELRALPVCRRVVVAINPDNARSQAFFSALGARPLEARNYDGDPMYELSGATGSAS